MAYDPHNVFARILRGEIPCQPVWEDAWALAFPDLHPRAKIHVLVIPKGPYENVYDFCKRASAEEQAGFARALVGVIEKLGLQEPGFKLITRCGEDGGQEVPHYHVHVLGGQRLG